MLFPANVNILYKTTDGKLISNQTVKNMVLKTYGIYSYINFILGNFKNSVYIDSEQYIPKYLAVGSNTGGLTGAPGTETAVKVSDISLYHEIIEDIGESNPNRIKLNRVNYIDDDTESSTIKLQYEAYIPEYRYEGETIGELALMTQQNGWFAFARVSGFEPFIKQPNTVVQVVWEISITSIESSNRLSPPVKKYLRECIEKAIDVLSDYKNYKYHLNVDDENPASESEDLAAREALNRLIQPATTLNTGLYYLLNDNDYITQNTINIYLSKPFDNINNTGLIPLIQHFDKDFKPNLYENNNESE